MVAQAAAAAIVHSLSPHFSLFKMSSFTKNNLCKPERLQRISAYDNDAQSAPTFKLWLLRAMKLRYTMPWVRHDLLTFS
jgi:hypothetical protein